jgi:L-histidine Nalpha-methyltransferase
MTATAAWTIDVHLGPDELERELRRDVEAGLTTTPKSLPPKWFYDDLGSCLFDCITRLPEYYPTRRERAILDAHAGDIAARSGADTMIELGSGTSTKTRMLLDAFQTTGRLRRFVPLDVSEPTLREAATALTNAHPDLEVHAVVGDFERHLALLPAGGRRMVAFLGGTIGNLDPDARSSFLKSLAATLEPGDALLLGTDLVKDPARLVAAYDDAVGVTAAFNKNVLAVVNRALDAHFDPRQFEHVALWDAEREWIEMRLRSLGDQIVMVDALGLGVRFAPGEEMRTEISAKFRREGVEAELGAAGFTIDQWWTDPSGDFALSLSFRT